MREENAFWNGRVSNMEWWRLQRCKGDKLGAERFGRIHGSEEEGSNVGDVFEGLMEEGTLSPLFVSLV
jgi:hypothetical protein